MKTIVVATDFSIRSDRALRRATLLAKPSGAGLMLVHVIDDDQPERMIETEQSAASALLADLARTVEELDGIPCRWQVVVGEPFEGIGAAAEAAEADLVVVGPHRRKALRDLFIGTTAQRTITRTHHPIVMANALPGRAYARILLATDLSETADRAYEVARALGLLDGPEVAVAHVCDAPAEALLMRTMVMEPEREAYRSKAETDARHALDRHLDAHGLRPTSSFVRIAEVTVAHTILGCAKAFAADLIVVGTHGRSGVHKIVMGSVAEELLGTSDLDVLAVPPGA